MSGQLYDFIINFLPGYILIVLVVLLPLLLIIIAWKGMDFIVNRFGDLAIYSLQSKRRFRRMGDDKTREELLHSLRTLDPKEFEYYVASIFENVGAKARVVGGHGSGDGGIDIVLYKNGITSFVQCKKYIGRGIGVVEVRDFYGAISDQLHIDSKSKGHYVTTTFFTESAQKFAKGRQLELYDGDRLMDIVFRQEGSGDKVGLSGRDRGELLRTVPPICPVCRRPLTRHQKDHSIFIGCTGYPSCRYTYSITQKND